MNKELKKAQDKARKQAIRDSLKEHGLKAVYLFIKESDYDKVMAYKQDNPDKLKRGKK